jgi:hypothetical protein
MTEQMKTVWSGGVLCTQATEDADMRSTMRPQAALRIVAKLRTPAPAAIG